MKFSRLTFIPLLLLVIISCEEESNLVMEPIVYTNAPCDDCPEVSIEYPRVIEDTKIGRAVNAGITEEIIGLLTFSDSLEVTDINEAVNSFTMGYTELKSVYPDETVPWEARIRAEVSFENHRILSVRLDSYLFTGGAHGYTSTNFLNFDVQKGEKINTQELFRDLLAFRSYAEEAFRKQENIPADAPINSTGFMFELDSFYLPANIGLTPKGILLLYNQYEVASYADGQIQLTIPFKEAKQFITPGMKL
ncbi:DUF3298 and DUF4163 domain-containing protein [Muriicola marianensis]|uniref:DUF4163 domain-containing protein n=1 Tax=Muriicola marianensis TaxID=1324801 RepID=A0ABQ1QY67_9FLAO|nr:DUF3298 and DUF4163 domain-containing protein [Muriicola marianensis]GGD51634.1 hypothetical protein GCM10011361_17910 [Muriicola marianensis]